MNAIHFLIGAFLGSLSFHAAEDVFSDLNAAAAPAGALRLSAVLVRGKCQIRSIAGTKVLLYFRPSSPHSSDKIHFGYMPANGVCNSCGPTLRLEKISQY